MDEEHQKQLEAEHRRRLALADRIARAIAILDPEPDPERLDGLLEYCRVCRLLLERYRAAAALFEQDPELLREAGTREVVRALRNDIEKHCRASTHEPLLEAITALATAVARVNASTGSGAAP
jgi:hypothetical protein